MKASVTRRAAWYDGRQDWRRDLILFDLLFEATAGALCAAASREAFQQGAAPLASRSFGAGMLWSGLFYVPAAVFFVRLWPDWSSHYLFDAASHPVGAALFAYADAALLFVAFALGHAIAARHIRRGRLASLARWLGLSWVALLVLLFVVLGDRSLAVTSTAAFTSRAWPRLGPPWGDPEGLYGRPIMAWLLASGAWNGISLALVLRWIRVRG